MIETLIIMSTFCAGLAISLEEGMILHWLYKFLDRKITNKWIRKPLFTCVYCFSSFWGSIVYWIIQGQGNITREIIIYWIILTICAVFVNGVLFNGFKSEMK